MRRRVVLLALASSAAASGCGLLLGVDERPYRPGDTPDAALFDGPVADAPVASAPDVEATTPRRFCVGDAHAFCDDFDDYGGDASALYARWDFLPQPPLIEGGLALVDGAVSPPFALLAQATAPPLPGLGKASIAAILKEVRDDGVAPVTGVSVQFQLNVRTIEPSPDAEPLPDMAAQLVGVVFSLIDKESQEGVGVLVSRNGAYLGYAANVFVSGAFASGQSFLPGSPVTRFFLPLRVVVTRRNARVIGDPSRCVHGATIFQDAGADADVDAGGGSVADDAPVVAVFVAGRETPSACEVLGGQLTSLAWVRRPLLAVGSIVTGSGAFEARFDDVAVDFLHE